MIRWEPGIPPVLLHAAEGHRRGAAAYPRHEAISARHHVLVPQTFLRAVPHRSWIAQWPRPAAACWRQQASVDGMARGTAGHVHRVELVQARPGDHPAGWCDRAAFRTAGKAPLTAVANKNEAGCAACGGAVVPIAGPPSNHSVRYDAGHSYQ